MNVKTSAAVLGLTVGRVGGYSGKAERPRGVQIWVQFMLIGYLFERVSYVSQWVLHVLSACLHNRGGALFLVSSCSSFRSWRKNSAAGDCGHGVRIIRWEQRVLWVGSGRVGPSARIRERMGD